MKKIENYIHDPEFQDFAVHQLVVGHVEHLITLFDLSKSGQLPVVEAHPEIKTIRTTLKPLTSSEVQEFDKFIKDLKKLT